MSNRRAMWEPERSITREADFHAWLLDQAGKLRAGRLVSLKRDDLAEELEAVARKDRLELRSRLQNLLSHLLKWAYEPSHRGKSWTATINESRDCINDLVEESPSLKNELISLMSESRTYARAVRDATWIPRAKSNFRSIVRGSWTVLWIPRFSRKSNLKVTLTDF